METAELPVFELDRKQPLQQQIHAQLVQWIGQGRLTPGIRLPASRQLSDRLAVSRNTVTSVLDQLKAEGFVESEIGRGSFVAQDIPQQLLEPAEQRPASAHRIPALSDFAKRLSVLQARHHQQALPFTPGVPDLANFPHGQWQKLWRRHQDRTRLMGYDSDQGYTPLREALAEYLRVSRGVRCHSSQILITQGAQQAISLCAQLLLNEGDTLLHENPGYKGASSAFAARYPNLISVPLKDQVIDVDWIEQHTELTAQAKLVYTTPTHQYPMGGLLSASQRLSLLHWAQTHQAWIIEDDYDSEFHFLHKPVAALQGMTPNANVIYMGSFSKTLFPSLRLGYLVLPEPLVATFTVAKSFIDGESPLLPQAVIADFISEGFFVRHLRRMRQLYKAKWTHLEGLIQQQLSVRVRIIADSAGMHLVVEIPNIDDQALKRQLAEQGFGCSSLSSYYQGVAEKTGLVLGFANTTAVHREALVSLLKTLLIA